TVQVSTNTGTEVRDVLVTDVAAALARIDKPSPLEHTPFHELVTDPAHMAALVEALTHLATVRPDRIPATGPAPPPRRRVAARITAAVGPALLRFALGLDTTAGNTATSEDAMPDDPEQPAATGRGVAVSANATQVRSGTVTTVVDALSEAQRSRLRRDVDKLL